MKKILLLSILLSAGLTAQTTYQDTLVIPPSNKDVVAVLAAYGMASMMTDAVLPISDNYNARVASSLVKVAIIIVAKWYVDKTESKKIPPMFLQAAVVSMAYYDLKARDLWPR